MKRVKSNNNNEVRNKLEVQSCCEMLNFRLSFEPISIQIFFWGWFVLSMEEGSNRWSFLWRYCLIGFSSVQLGTNLCSAGRRDMVGEAGEYTWPCLILPPPNTSSHCGAQHSPELSGLGNSGQALAKCLSTWQLDLPSTRTVLVGFRKRAS